MTHGTHDAQDDPRNADVLIYLNGELVPRDRAKVSVFDSGFMLGDGVWEGLRLHHGKLAFLGDRRVIHVEWCDAPLPPGEIWLDASHE
jgi:branched-chain amino acid aminotransferase